MRTLFFLMALFFLAQTQAQQDKKSCERPRDNVYTRYLHTEKLPIPYDFIHEKDVFWEKKIWRLIDTREKMNHSFRNEKNPFIKMVIDAAMNEEITLYSSIDDAFSDPLDLKEIRKLLYSTDTALIYDPVTFKDSLVIVEDEFNYMDVKKYRIKEVWFFDEETSRMYVRILGIAPIITYYLDDGSVIGEGPMFWLYYPDCRNLFARNEVFNPYNDAMRMSWDDLFEARFFSSYITKENNNYDRRIQDYVSSPIDMLLESEKIKESIFNFEQDLWSY